MSARRAKQYLAPEAPDGLMWRGFNGRRVSPHEVQQAYADNYQPNGQLLEEDMFDHWSNDPAYHWGQNKRRKK